MRWIDGFFGAMRPVGHARRSNVQRLDELTAERLLSGSLPPADAPPEFRHVAAALRDLAQQPTNDELAGQTSSVDQITAVIRSGSSPPSTRRRSQTSWKIRSVMVAAAVLAVGLGTTTGLAFAGALPDGAQSFAAHVLDNLGVSVPTPTHHSKPPADTDGPRGSTGGPVTTTLPAAGGTPASDSAPPAGRPSGGPPGQSPSGARGNPSPPGLSNPNPNGKSNGHTPPTGHPNNGKGH